MCSSVRAVPQVATALQDICVAETDHVGVALTDNGFTFVDDAFAVGVQPVEQSALVVDLCVADRVLVFGAFSAGKYAAAEACKISPLIGYREHDPSTERVLLAIRTVDEPEAAVSQVSRVQLQVFSQFIPPIGSPTEFVLAHHRAVITSRTQIATGRTGISSVEQPLMVELGCFGYRVKQ